MADSNKLQNFTGTHKCVHKHTTHRKNTITGWAVVAHTFSTQQAEAGRSLRVQDQAGLDRVSRQPGIAGELAANGPCTGHWQAPPVGGKLKKQTNQPT